MPRRTILAIATTAALATAAPTASAVPIHDVGFSTEPERLQVVRVQVDGGMDWSDAGIGAAGMLALMVVGYGGARALATTAGSERSAARS
jgi:hypothetical protein